MTTPKLQRERILRHMTNIDVFIRGRLSTEEDAEGLTEALYECVLNTDCPEAIAKVMAVLESYKTPKRVTQAYLDAVIVVNKSIMREMVEQGEWQ